MKLSIVTTMYNSRDFLREFHERAGAAARALTDDYEIILVNDGSPDDCLEIAGELHAADAHVVVVDLSRNFGHHHAIMAGLAHARGDKVFLLDVDLEEDPEYLIEFDAALAEEKADVIYGVQAKRRGNWFEIVSGDLFYGMMKSLGGVAIPRNLMTVRLMTRRFVDNLLKHGERQMIISGLWQATGFRQVARAIAKRPRTHESTYTVMGRIRFAIDHVTISSNNLLYYVFYFGLGIFLLSLVMMTFAIASYLLTGSTLSGWTSIIASIWMFGGVSILLIGLVGIYVARIFEETKQRPNFIVRDVARREAAKAAEARKTPQTQTQKV